MKNLLTFILILMTQQLFSQEAIELLPPRMSGGKPLMEALKDRHSSRNFTTGKLTPQQLSDLLWAACGINRPADGKRTMPSSRNVQEIDVYIATSGGLYLYDFKNHRLTSVLNEDIRKQTGKQDFVEVADINLIYVADYSRIEGDPKARMFTTGVDVGVMVQNVYLFCSSEGLGCVVRAWFDKEPLTRAMKLRDDQEIIMTQTVGVVGTVGQ